MTTSDTTRDIAEFRRLIRAISPDDHDVTAQLQAFQREIDRYTDGPLHSGVLLMLFSDATAWTSSYSVDWKDRESTVAAVNTLAKLWRVDVDWGVPDPADAEFLDRFDVHELLDIAHVALERKGFRLWGFETSGDSYAGWLAPVSRDPVFREIAVAINHDFYPEGTGLSLSQAASRTDANRRRAAPSVGTKITSALTIAALVPVVLILKGLKKTVDAMIGPKS